MSKVWEDQIIFETVAGSQLYGTATPQSDLDLRGICHQTLESLLGMQGFEQYEDKSQDRTIWGLVKFCTLAADCNPNIIEILFAPTSGPTCIVMSETWERLLSIRPAFISKRARHTFSGYAYSQLERINRHYRWIREGAPPDPSPLDYGAIPVADSAENNNWKWATSQDKNAYQNAREKYRQYTHWLQERNPARRELEQRWGYDTKNAQHLCRLMLQGAELLETGHLTLPRPEAAWLQEVRNGLFSYDEIVQWAADRQENLNRLEQTSTLPWGPDRGLIEEMVIDINHDQAVNGYVHALVAGA